MRRYPSPEQDMLSVGQHREDRAVWVDRLEQEYANVRAALSWLIVDDPGTAAAIAAALAKFWDLSGRLDEGSDWLREILQQSDRYSDDQRMYALKAVGEMAIVRTEHSQAQLWLDEALTLSRQADSGAEGSALVMASAPV